MRESRKHSLSAAHCLSYCKRVQTFIKPSAQAPCTNPNGLNPHTQVNRTNSACRIGNFCLPIANAVHANVGRCIKAAVSRLNDGRDYSNGYTASGAKQLKLTSTSLLLGVATQPACTVRNIQHVSPILNILNSNV